MIEPEEPEQVKEVLLLDTPAKLENELGPEWTVTPERE